MSGAEAAVRDTLGAVVGRLRRLHALQGIAAGGATAAVASGLFAWARGDAFANAAAGACAGAIAALVVVRRRAGSRTPAAAARAVERDRPEFRNLLITSEELLRSSDLARDWVRERVFADTAARARGIVAASHVRVTRAAMLAVATLAVWGASLAAVHRPAREAVRLSVAAARSTLTGAPAVRVTVTPPAYTGASAITLADPERIDALEGSELRVAITGSDLTWRVRLGPAELPVHRDGRTSAATVRVTTSGYLAVEPLGAPAASRSLISVAVTPDRVPGIAVEAPGRDLLLPDASQRIPIRAIASDDLGLRSLELRYTRVSGSGERFDFVEGTLPLSVDRDSPTSWRATTELPLPALGLEQGDSLVYRLVARDGRPGDEGLGASDTFFVEVAAPGQPALAGADLPSDRDRYALSQQMIVLKIERLRAREAAMAAPARRGALETLAAEQRAVRANFVFLMGGHVEDEEVEAEQSHEIQEGRLENRARRDISAAVHQMTLSERGLAALSTSAALPPAKAAVEALQRAFGHSRYILRAAPQRNRIDQSRRLQGDLTSTAGWLRQRAAPGERTPAGQARALIGRLRSIEASGLTQRTAGLSQLAEDALAVDPTSPDWRAISETIAARRLDEARQLLHRQAARDALPRPDGLPRRSRLWSAWAEGGR